MNLFPCGWRLPSPRGLKPVKSLAEHHFHPKTLKISAQALEPVRATVKQAIPECERCIGEQNDFSEIDRMLEEMNDPSSDAKTMQILRTIKIVTENLSKNILVIENAPAAESDNISRKDLLKLLNGFLNFTRTIENHIKATQCFY